MEKRLEEEAKILWNDCEDCGAQLYIKRMAARRPKYCDACRKVRQDKFRKEK